MPDFKKFYDPNKFLESYNFDLIKDAYSKHCNMIHTHVQQCTSYLDDTSKTKIKLATNLILGACSPSNHLMGNKEALKEAINTNGQSLIRGLYNLQKDIKKQQIPTSSENDFIIGENIACTPGQVIYENEMMQLIYYTPSTKKIYKTPLLIIPPWINKFYILDLQPHNSFVKWIVDQGTPVFLISWINPDATLRYKNFSDYVLQGPEEALDKVLEFTQQKEANLLGYCIGGTLLATFLAYQKALGVKNVKSATYLTSLIDFSISGDIGALIDEQLVTYLESRMSLLGYCDKTDITAFFNYLKSENMIWHFMRSNYLMGKKPEVFDMLYWNSDGTRLPETMHKFYLRNMYMQNNLVKPNILKINNTSIDVTSVNIKSYLLATLNDHIVPWQGAYKSAQALSGRRKFVLAEGGHIAGVINPPSKNTSKYAYYAYNANKGKTLKIENLTKYQRSWWYDWYNWLQIQTENKINAYQADKFIEPAPGRYVQKK